MERNLPAPPLCPSDYERAALEAIYQWKNPSPGWMGAVKDRAYAAWNGLTELACEIPGVEWTIENVVTGLMRVINEIAQDSVWTDAVHGEYRQGGHPVLAPHDIHRLDLADVDACLDGLRMKYTALGAVEGATTGFAGAAGIVPDVVALVALNLRAAGEHAAYCGFDVSHPSERLYAMQILDVVSRTSSKARDVAFTPAVSLAGRVAKQQSLQTIEQLGVSQAIERLARALGLRLTGAKLAQAAPVAGAVVGGGFNTYYTHRVCEAAYHLYRERFLFEKYGPAVFVEGPRDG